MKKRTNTYKLNLELLETVKPVTTVYEPIEFEFDNHDNIFDIIALMKARDMFKTPQQSVEFAIGLKLFSEVMLKNSDNVLFEEFRPAFSDFMKKLKGK
ncbi:DUF3861 domain-containing protein [Maribacter sp. CXY002]|uniref:DUF3861 domain-containing protein n=1 Tax=Maribacter luteocoastalis TaxID=3407671 RepID=UPI003B66B6F6